MYHDKMKPLTIFTLFQDVYKCQFKTGLPTFSKRPIN